jgi:hypothetical protein
MKTPILTLGSQRLIEMFSIALRRMEWIDFEHGLMTAEGLAVSHTLLAENGTFAGIKRVMARRISRLEVFNDHLP